MVKGGRSGASRGTTPGSCHECRGRPTPHSQREGPRARDKSVTTPTPHPPRPTPHPPPPPTPQPPTPSPHTDNPHTDNPTPVAWVTTAAYSLSLSLPLIPHSQGPSHPTTTVHVAHPTWAQAPTATICVWKRQAVLPMPCPTLSKYDTRAPSAWYLLRAALYRSVWMRWWLPASAGM